MPFNAAQLAMGSNTQLDYFAKNKPVDQVNTSHPLLKFLMDRKQFSPGGNQFYVEQLYISNDSNYQNYFGAGQVTYNERDGIRQARYPWYNHHDGFGFDEDRLAANGIILTDDGEAVATKAEKVQLTNLLETGYDQLKKSIHAGLADEMWRDGSTNADAAPGVDALISTTPAVGTVGGLNAANFTWWRNNASTGIAAANLVDQMEIQWRACTRFGGEAPDFIVCGSEFLDTYRRQAGVTINRRIETPQRGGVSLDASTDQVFFKGIPLVWDPTLDTLDARFGTPPVPWIRRCYFINSNHLKLRPVTGQWMVNRKPERVYDRYVHYWGMTSKYRLTTNKRNAHAVLSVA